MDTSPWGAERGEQWSRYNKLISVKNNNKNLIFSTGIFPGRKNEKLLMTTMISCRKVRASDCQCQSRNSPGFDPSIIRHSGFWGAADEASMNNVHSPGKKLSKTNRWSFSRACPFKGEWSIKLVQTPGPYWPQNISQHGAVFKQLSAVDQLLGLKIKR